MHNTYMDMIFEYGVVPMTILFLVCAGGVFRWICSRGGPSRLWILYLASLAIMALGQHLLYAFTHLCLLLPAFLILPRVILKQTRG
jgi:hypothetical protein